MHCGRVTNLLSSYLDRELTGAEMLQMREHLEQCAPCRQAQAELVSVKALLGRSAPVAPRGDYVSATLRRLSEVQGAARTETRRPRWLAWWWGVPGQRLRLSGLATALGMALVATGMALQQPKDSDAVVGRIARMGMDEWSERPWEMNRLGVSALPASWAGANPELRPAAFSWPRSTDSGGGGVEDTPLLVRHIVALQTSGFPVAGR